MTYVTGVAAGTRINVRMQLGERELKKQPPGTWPGPVLAWGPGGDASAQVPRYELFVEDVKRDKRTQDRDWRHLTLWGDPHRQAWVMVIDTESAESGTAVYRVLGSQGELLARVTRRRGSIFRFARTSWRVEVSGGPVLLGRKGHLAGWFLWWLFSPVWAVMLVLIPLGGEFPRMPLTTRWGCDGQEVMHFDEGSYRAVSGWPDARLVHAVTMLHWAHPTVLGDWSRP
ncbi:hypothetical protein OG892_13190 [Streptomyces sp. NBC_00341]|uniref:hypothetical protein n=1 Tax=Streptomyces sp. NBC_00341 TaxID=2975717 RepID=UPI00308BD6B7|nr:hypothetical protein OG892_13190 [Streptomyces sp. NBC_00341]